MLQVIKADEVRDGEPRLYVVSKADGDDVINSGLATASLHTGVFLGYPLAIVNRPATTPAPGLDLDAVERACGSFAKYHTEHARFGGASREFHERAETFIGATVPALIAEVRALRKALTAAPTSSELAEFLAAHDRVVKDRDAEIARRAAKLATAKRIGREFAAMCAANKYTTEMLAALEAL